MKNNVDSSFANSPLAHACNRWTGALRKLVLRLDPDVVTPIADGEPAFMFGGTLGLDQLAKVAAWSRALEQVDGAEPELVYVEFGSDPDGVNAPRAIHVLLRRDNTLLIRRDCTLWLDRDGKRSALMSPRAKGGHFVHEANELVNLPGQPTRSMAPGVARARKRLAELAAEMSTVEARLCFEPV